MNPAEPVTAFDATHTYVTWQSDDDPVQFLMASWDGSECSEAVQVNSTPGKAEGAGRYDSGPEGHDAPSVFVDGLGYIYVTYLNRTIGHRDTDEDPAETPLFRRSTRPLDITEWEPEQGGRMYNYAEVNGLQLAKVIT